MPRRFVKDLEEKENVEEVFLASAKQLRPNRNGSLYLQVDLSDRSGSICARMWNANEKIYRSFDNGDYIRVEGSTQIFQGSIQMIAKKITKVSSGSVDEADFTILTSKEIDTRAGQLSQMLRGMSNIHLLNLAECFLVDDPLMSKFCRAPAGIKNHHAYHGGLLDHVVSLMGLVTHVAGHYEQLDGDLLLMGAFLHDLGKIDELAYDRNLEYTDEGQLIGHMVMAVGMLEKKIAEAEKLSDEPFPEELALRLKHMIISHHGQYEFGSPKLPMTLEAITLHFLDNLDSKLYWFEQLIREDPNVDSSWTTYQSNLGRKLFKGHRPSTEIE